MSSIAITFAQRTRTWSRKCPSWIAPFSGAVIALAAMLMASPQGVQAANECGAPVGGTVICSGTSYPSPGINYSATAQTLVLNNANLVAQKTVNGTGTVYLAGGGTNVNDLVINALMFQSVQSTAGLSNGLYVYNPGTAGNAIIRMDTGSVTASSNFATSGSLLALIGNSAGTGNALITLNGGQVINTGTLGAGINARNIGTGNAGITMTGGSVSTAGGIGLSAIIGNAASSGAANVTIGGGTVTTASGTGVLSQSELGNAGITMTAGTVTVQNGSNPAVNAVVNNTAGTGTASIAVSGGTVTNNGSGDGLFASNKGTGTYNVNLTGGTVTGGAGASAAIHADAAAGGTIVIGSGAIVNAGASGVALNQTGGAATITTAGTVTGNVNLSAANNVLDVTGGAVNGNISSGGNSALKFDLGAGSFTYGAAYAISGINSVAMNSGSAEIDGSLVANTLAVNGGNLIVNSAATVSSGTTISAGTLQIGNGGTSGSITGAVTNNGVLAFDRSDIYTFAGQISGSGSLDQIGSGSTVLSAAGNSVGATRIDAGTLQVNNVSLTSTGGITINAGTLQNSGGSSAITTPTITMNAGSKLNIAGGTVQAGGGAQTLFTGGTGGATINITGGALFGNGTLGGGGNVVNLTAGSLNTGAAALNLGSGNDTFLLSGLATVAGAGVDGGAGTDALQVNTSVNRTLDGAFVTNFETLSKSGAGTLTLTGSHGYSGGTTISAGTLQIGNGATDGTLATPSVANSGALVFALSSDYTFGGTISGTGRVNKTSTGTTTLTGNNSYAGPTTLTGGALLINGDQSGATGQTSVGNGATLGGTGVIGGNVTVANGGTLAPGGAGNAPGTLTIKGGLTLNNTSNLNVDFGQANMPGGPLNDLINVGGNLTLDGTLNVTQTPGGTFGPGIYRIINYNGSLIDNGLAVTDPNYFVQTAVANQVNLVNSTGLALSYWDGDAGPHSNSLIDGGSGTWRASGDQNWTDSSGLFAAPFANASFAIFQGAAGTVSVDGTNGQVQVAGMQFATDGYLIQGGDVALVGPQSIIRVGDGSVAGASYTATIASNLTGAGQLVKTDLGTLVLSGSNGYTGGTAINGGTLQISADTNLGASSGALSFDSGILRTTAAIVSDRSVTLNAGGGTFDTLDTLTLNGSIGGGGALTKTDVGTLVLSGANTYTGGTMINGGVIEVAADANLGDAAGALAFDSGALHTTASFASSRSTTLNVGGGIFDTDNLTTLTLSSAVGGAGALTKDGAGTLVLAADSSYAGGTAIAAGTLQLGDGGATGSITGNVVDNGILAFNRNNTYSFAGLISGTGGLDQAGSGVTILTANNSYAGTTNVRSGTLIVNGDQSAATGVTVVEAGGTLGGTGTIGGNVSVLDSGALSPGNIGSTPGTLTINGNLTLAATATLNYNLGQAGVVGGPYNDLTVVHGNLTLGGFLNASETPGGSFGPGIYRIISYDGTLTDLGLADNSPNYIVQTSVANQVNLVNIAGLTLNYWDGDAGPKSNALVDGGNGTWRASGDDNWADAIGQVNARFSNGSFAVFGGAAGTVQVDNTNGQVQAAGMQFASNGYTVQGDNITLVGPQSIIRVGDGTTAGAGYTATIASVLQGSSQLVKADLGTLVLTGNNTYTGGTRINQGTLQFTTDANLGAASGNLTLDGGTLRNTNAIALARGVTLEGGNGTFETLSDLTINGVVDGVGGFTKTGTAGLTLTGANSYAGQTVVSAGSLYVDGNQSGAAGLTSVLSGATLGGRGTIGGNVTIADGGTLSPGSANGAPGTLTIAGNLKLSSGSVLNYSLGQANVPGGTLNDLTTVGGNLVLDGTLNVTVPPSGTFSPGIYRLFNYAGSLTNNGLTVGAVPSSDYFVQTAIANQVNLVNTNGLTLNYWDGGSGGRFDGVINGGDGIWQSSAGNSDWSDGNGLINAPYDNAGFAVFAGAAGRVTVDNSHGQVTASGMQFITDGYVIQGGAIDLIGSTATIRVGDGTSASAGITATIASELAGTSQLVKTDLGTLVLTGANSYTGGTAIEAGTLQLGNGGTTGSLVGDVIDNGTLAFDRTDKYIFNGVISGSGAIRQIGSGLTRLTGDSSAFSGTTSIEAGTLSVNGSLCGDINVLAGGRLQGTGTVCDTNNFAGGTVAPGNSIGTLTVAGNYTGNGGTLEIESQLGGDNSPTDRLIVTGNTSGTTTVKVINVGGAGAQTVEGIRILEVGGASNGVFNLAGDYLFQGQQAVIGGAYAYRLYKGGVSTPSDGDWYLRSTYTLPVAPTDPVSAPQPLYAPGVPLYEAYAGVLQSFNELGTLQQRIGNRTWGNGEAMPQGTDMLDQTPTGGKAIWARIEAAHGKFEPETSTAGADYNATTWKFEAGLDGLFYDSEAGALIGGATVHYGTISSNVSSIFGTGSIDASGYGLGASLTWYGNSGFYADAQAQATWYDTDLSSATLGRMLTDGNSGFGYALSIETGQKIELRDNWSLTPQAQLSYSSVRFNDFTDPYGARVSLDDGQSLTGRIGLSADYENEWKNAAGQVNRSHVYGIANLYYDFLDGAQVDVSGTSLVSKNQPLWGGVGLGGSLSVGDRTTVYGEAFARTSLADFGDSNSAGAKVGFKVSW
ncbi:autotransporter outer membrane beta-barrel domain-containing protein [Rhizobium sp. BK491]|uniref:autotransporter outer membrane beta-barrel domain-containing protein n=1 Tax=Rhizobium sp. BK491 TaxID=2587009 RepID=UPI001613B162|nr:autotransporter outer membrane beta-barrel domain-containing protein [Rhizobium sp. BK491]MBB3571829.1 fibronectin-binding autotransporter adhesin [Rhizobium sp. BK491]